MGSKVSPITNIKQIQAYLQEESIKYQTIIFKINISEDIKNVGPPHQSPYYFYTNWFNEFHRLESWSLFMLEKTEKNQEDRLKIK